MAYRNRPPVSLALLLVGALDCAKAPARIVIGRLDLVFRPDSAAVSSRPLRGSFMLRDLETGTHQLVPIHGHANQTRSAWLDPGSYVLEWQPALELPNVYADARQTSGSQALAAERHVVVIADARVTTVNVRATLRVSAMHDAIAGVVER